MRDHSRSFYPLVFQVVGDGLISTAKNEALVGLVFTRWVSQMAIESNTSSEGDVEDDAEYVGRKWFGEWQAVAQLSAYYRESYWTRQRVYISDAAVGKICNPIYSLANNYDGVST